MKFSDIVLDLNTGDASVLDAYIQESVGQIRVSSAIFDAAQKISEADGYERNTIIQEAAAAGLPSDPSKARELAGTAIEEALKSYVDLIKLVISNVNNVAQTGYKTFVGIGKKYKLSAPKDNEEFVESFAKPLANAIVSSSGEKKISLNTSRFLKGTQAKKLAGDYIKGILTLTNTIGIGVPCSEDSLITSIAKPIKCTKTTTLKCIESGLSAGCKLLKTDSEKSRYFTSTPSAEDIFGTVVSLRAVMVLAQDLGKIFKDKNSVAWSKSLIEEIMNSNISEKKINSTCVSINEDVAKWADILVDTSKALISAFNDSASALESYVEKNK